MSLYGLKKQRERTHAHTKQVLSFSKLAHVTADKQHAGRYICLLLLHNPNSVTQRV